jgi:hypothetical protein
MRRAALAGAALACVGACAESGRTVARVHDAAQLVPAREEAALEKELALTQRETGVQLYFATAALGAEASLERSALETFAALHEAALAPGRGALLLYDAARGRLRIEVGYELEELFSDARVGELIDEHARPLFDSGAVATALRLTLRILRDELRRASLAGASAAPPAPLLFASGGGGASGDAPLGAHALRAFDRGAAVAPPREGPAASVEASYERYLTWLARGRFETDLALFTPRTRAFLARWPMTPGYLEHVLDLEEGREVEILERGDRALLFCVDDPFVAPHFFVRGAEGWQIDLASEAREVLDVVGGPYAWAFRDATAPALAPFADELVRLDGFLRVRGGDNRRAGDPAARRARSTGRL